MVHALVFSALMLAADAPAAAPPVPADAATAPASSGTPAAKPAAEEKGAVDKALDRMPAILWDKDASTDEKVSKLVSVSMGAVGVVALVAAALGVGLTAALQLSPYPEGSDFRKQPRSTYVMASMAITSVSLVLGVVCVLGAIFAVFIA